MKNNIKLINSDKIPYIIHYCWFGNKKKPILVRKCISSWKKHLPNYEIIEWNEKNTDLSHPFLYKAYSQGKFAFVSDYIRLRVLHEYGGIYLDTDMLVLKTLDNLLNNKCFFGAEDTENISCGIIGSVKNNLFIKECLNKYDSLNVSSNMNWTIVTIPYIITLVFRAKFNFNNFFINNLKKDDIIIYSTDYFYSLPYQERYNWKNYNKFITKNSYAIHLWNGSWLEQNEFHYLRKREYIKGFKIVFKNILLNRKFSYKYIRKIISGLIESFKK